MTTATADAYRVEFANGDVEYVDASELSNIMDGLDYETVTPLACIRSWDHGLRSADELAFCIVTEIADWIIRPLMALYGLETDGLDAWATLAVDIGQPDYSGGWIDVEDSGWIYERRDDAESAASDVGVILETSADAGMTWAYVPV